MKVALLADIHGNASALAVVADSMRQCGVSRVLVAGDIVGYYPDVSGVLDILDEWEWAAIGGNHEAMLDDWRRNKNREIIQAKYGRALDVILQRLTKSQIEMLTSLPPTLEIVINDRNVLLCHGTPWNRDEYVYPDAPDSKRQHYLDGPADIIVFGHTHYPVLWEKDSQKAVNPGSVGQPRDGIPGACWALWNSEDNSVTFKRESYDSGNLVKEMKALNPELPYLWEILGRTRD